MKKYVCGFAVTDSGKISLIKKNKPEWQKGKLNGLGGKIEKGETIHEAMRREFMEEAGLDINKWEHRITLIGDNDIVHFFIARVEKEFEFPYCVEGQIDWYSLQSVLNEPQLIPNLKWVVPFCMQSEFVKIEVMMK